jgi:ribosomal protein S18 acetylase RimI-like enzyme
MKIETSTIDDITEIFKLYKIATDYQKTKLITHWPVFEKEMIEKEIFEKRQFKILIDNKIACIWTIDFNDPLIWQQKDKDPAIYIHRIATNPDFRGQNLVTIILDWAKEYALKNKKLFIRMDTVGENTKLIDYYRNCGFDFLGLSKLENTSGLPTHYHKATVSLFEVKI